MKTSDSALQIPFVKRAFSRLAEFAKNNKYYLLIAILVLATPVAVGLTFAEGETNEGDEISEVGEEDGEEEAPEDEAEEGELDVDGEEDDEIGEDEEESEAEVQLDSEEDVEEKEEEEEKEDTDELLETVVAKSLKRYTGARTTIRGSSDFLRQRARGSSHRTISRGDSGLPSYYNSREQAYGQNIAIKNQNSEGLCWAYSISSLAEYYLSKNGLADTSTDLRVSAKHMDYQNVLASRAYKESDVAAGKTNVLYDRLYSLGVNRELGEGGSDANILMAIANPLAIMSEADFVAAIKANDSRISLINAYEDIWKTGLSSTVLTVSGGSKAYTTKQNFSDMNNVETTKYVVTGAKTVFDDVYGESSTKTQAVNSIKAAVKAYGAVSAGTFLDEDNCLDYDFTKDSDDNPLMDENGVYQLNYTIIDRGVDVCDNSSGHQMTIVGWDDSWTYMDGEDQETGAFIVQNSYGDSIEDMETGSGTIKVHENFYLSYSSVLDTIYLDSIERLTDYDHYYSAEDYGAPVIPVGSDELVFELTTDGPEMLKELSLVDAGVVNSNFSVYVSWDGTTDGFTLDGVMPVEYGINKYVFADDIFVDGDFAIKLVSSRGIDNIDRELSVITVFTDDYESPEETFTLTLDANDGSFSGDVDNTVSCTTIEGSCEVNIPDITPSISDKTFMGWADSDSASSAEYEANETLVLSADKVIYAVYGETDPGVDPEPEPEPQLSDNAYLASLEVHYKVDGEEKVAEISPKFSKEELKYEVYMPEIYDIEAFGDEISVLVVTETEEDGANAEAKIEVVDARTDSVVITVTAPDGKTEMHYELMVYYPSPEVPETGDDVTPVTPTAPRVPNTGFMLRTKGDAKQGGLAIVIIVLGVVALYAVAKIATKKTKVESEAIIFVSEK